MQHPHSRPLIPLQNRSHGLQGLPPTCHSSKGACAESRKRERRPQSHGSHRAEGSGFASERRWGSSEAVPWTFCRVLGHLHRSHYLWPSALGLPPGPQTQAADSCILHKLLSQHLGPSHPAHIRGGWLPHGSGLSSQLQVSDWLEGGLEWARALFQNHGGHLSKEGVGNSQRVE